MNAPLSISSIRINDLRVAMRAQGLDAYLVPSSDPHLSEYLPRRWQGRRWLSGFNGSVGTLVVTADFAGLWVDSRYWTQAEAELAGSGIALMKIAVASSPAHLEWLSANMAAGSVVGADGMVLGLANARALQEAVALAGASLRTDIDLLECVWADRPGLPDAPIYTHKAPYAEHSRAEKLARLRTEMGRLKADHHFISTLDDLAWLFNLRGSDVNYNPVFVGHALIGLSGATLFVAAGKVDASLAAELADDGIAVHDYAQARAALAALPSQARILLDPRRVTLGLIEAIPADVHQVEAINPSTLFKSIKSAADAAHIRNAMEKDGAALANFFSQLELDFAAGQRITEVDIDTRICAARAEQEGFVCPSFATIAGFNGNGAMPHYRATDDSHAVIEGQGLLLIDSGGQYLDGTTDITRVMAIGGASPEQKRDFTLVLKGMIQLSLARFPRGTRSPLLDTLARAPIWAALADYGHGTGHGVGYFLNVHEGPHGITPFLAPEAQTAMELGMMTSNEPGLYRPGRWGIRIENLVLNISAGEGEFGEFLQFETLTLCPIDTRCVDLDLLDRRELDWLNQYHAVVQQRLSPRLQGAALAWLNERTQAI